MLLAEMKIDGEEGSCEGRGRGPCVLIPQNLMSSCYTTSSRIVWFLKPNTLLITCLYLTESD